MYESLFHGSQFRHLNMRMNKLHVSLHVVGVGELLITAKALVHDSLVDGSKVLGHGVIMMECLGALFTFESSWGAWFIIRPWSLVMVFCVLMFLQLVLVSRLVITHFTFVCNLLVFLLQVPVHCVLVIERLKTFRALMFV